MLYFNLKINEICIKVSDNKYENDYIIYDFLIIGLLIFGKKMFKFLILKFIFVLGNLIINLFLYGYKKWNIIFIFF